ncbi:MAG: hypothetical protein IKE70_01525 [Bacilli bacterium]|nr:hypothetical protein [Bacilli bacterium]
MDIEKLLKEMDEEERVFYLHSTASDYFNHIYNHSDSSFKKKIEKSEKLNEEEWEEVLKKLFLVTTKAVAEEEKIIVLDSLFYMISKICKTISFKDSAFHNECEKMMNYLWGMKKEKDVNRDLVYGYHVVLENRDESDLDILLRQHEEAAIFRDLKGYYDQEYNNTKTGSISRLEKMYANSMKRSYKRGVELTKKYYS